MTLTLQLGDFTFARFEIPENIPFGASQKLNVHTLVGGTRVIDALGKVPVNPGWSGWLIGENAIGRARYLKTLTEVGKPVKLSWSEFAYTVLVSAFNADFRRANRIPYQISFEVVSDDTATIDQAPPPSAEQLVSDDLKTATGLGALIGDSTLSSLIVTVSNAVRTVGSFASSPANAIAALGIPIGAARVQVGTLLAGANNVLAGVSGVGGIVAGGDPLLISSAFGGQITAAQNVPHLSTSTAPWRAWSPTSARSARDRQR